MRALDLEINMTVFYQNRRARIVDIGTKHLKAAHPRSGRENDGQRVMLYFEDNRELDWVPVEELRREGRGR